MSQKAIKNWCFLLLFILMPLSLLAQIIDVKGVVVDTDGEPIPGAIVKVKGTEKAVVTNVDGQFNWDIRQKACGADVRSA